MDLNLLNKYKYLYFKDEIRLEFNAYGEEIIIINKSGKSVFKGLVNKSASEIIQLINGKRTYNDMMDKLLIKYNEETKDSIEGYLFKVFSTLIDKYGVEVLASDVLQKSNLIYIRKTEILPTVASFEITNACNLRCIHCYGDYGKSQSNTMSLEDIKKILDDLSNNNVKIVELTGGDISVHPNLKQIVLHALGLNFDRIALLTNGIILSDEIIEIIIKNKEKLIVQIDLHSLDDKYLHWFTKVPNQVEKVKSNISKLAKNDVFLRVAMLVTEKNIDEIERVAEWAYAEKVKNFAISPILSLGRACKNQNLSLNTENEKKLFDTMEKLKIKYGNFIFYNPGKLKTNNYNCGCLTSHVTIQPDGNIKLCTMDNNDYFKFDFGNLLKNNLKTIYSNRQAVVSEIAKLKATHQDSDLCNQCENRFFCGGCILRSLVKASFLKEKCNWYKNLDETIKNIFKIHI